MEFTGKVIAVLKKQSGTAKSTGKPWSKQEYVVAETSGDYPKKMVFQVFGDEKIEQFNIKMGEELTVAFNVDANPWNERWFNTISAWKVDKIGGGSTQQSAPRMTQSMEDEMPF